MYTNFKRLSVEYCPDTYSFSFFLSGKKEAFACGKISSLMLGEEKMLPDTFTEFTAQTLVLPRGQKLLISYQGGNSFLKDFAVSFTISDTDIALRMETNRPEVRVFIDGEIRWGEDTNSTFAMQLDRLGDDFRAASGPAVSKNDNAVFDRVTDRAVELTGMDHLRLGYDWNRCVYPFRLSISGLGNCGKCRFTVHDNVYAKKHHLRAYQPVSGKTQYKAPPVGWMTWYAVKFDASEKTVLENTRWMAENLKDFGADTVWVDWEWYHSDMSGSEKEGIDTFFPSKTRYPNGLGAVADEISKCGFIPALWIGATNDVNMNAWLAQDSAHLLCDDAMWCGRYWPDPTHPNTAREFIPKVFRQLMDWGFEVFKWDCMPTSLQIYDKHHEKMFDRSMSSDDALRGLIAAARETIGNERYLMSCAGESYRDITLGMDIFDGGRIGLDIFNFDEFIENAVENIYRYYCFHNILMYNDPDNVVVRAEFNTIDEAISRATLVSLLGMPFTFGDNLPMLDASRVDILRRSIPILDIHPMDTREIRKKAGTVLTNLLIARSFASWQVTGIFNTEDKEKLLTVRLSEDMHLEDGKYLLYEFWGDEFTGVVTESMEVRLAAHQTKVFAVRERSGIPQILCTSRHVTCGGYDLEQVSWEKNQLHVTSKLIENYPYRVQIYIPDTYQFVCVDSGFSAAYKEGYVELSCIPGKTESLDWTISFEEKIK